jgi:hypothetical protein
MGVATWYQGQPGHSWKMDAMAAQSPLPDLAELSAQSSRTHLSLNKGCPRPRRVQFPSEGNIMAFPEVGGLHHRYERRAV